MVLGKLTAACKRIKLENSLTLYSKIYSKQINNINVRPDTIKLLEENIGWTLFDINHNNTFFLFLISSCVEDFLTFISLKTLMTSSFTVTPEVIVPGAAMPALAQLYGTGRRWRSRWKPFLFTAESTELRIVSENNVCVCVRTRAQPCLTLCDLMECSLLAPLSMEFSRQVYWSRLPFPT